MIDWIKSKGGSAVPPLTVYPYAASVKTCRTVATKIPVNIKSITQASSAVTEDALKRKKIY